MQANRSMSQRKKNSVSFSKKVSKSEVDNYYLSLKKEFFETHLPRRYDANIVLVDEDGREYNVRYVRKACRFQRGWRDFVFGHDLVEGDTVVFDMIDECKFKVRITRGSESIENEEFDEMEDLIDENACRDIVTRKRRAVDNHQIQHRSKQQANVEKSHSTPWTKLAVMDADSNFLTNKHMEALNRIKELEMQLGVGNVRISSSPKLNVGKGKGHQILEGDNESEEEMVDRLLLCRARKRVFEDTDLAENTKHVCIRSKSRETSCANGDSSLKNNDTRLSALSFKDVKSFGDFKIQVNGETLGSKIPITIQKKYYQLCRSQKEFIHDSIMKGLDSKLVVAMILSIVNIAEAMKDSSIWTSRDDLECKEKTLKSFEDLGMSVGSLRVTIGSLIKISREHKIAEDTLERERKLIKEKKAEISKLEENAIVLKERKEKLRFVFQKVAGYSW